jgi:hypothetical protein
MSSPSGPEESERRDEDVERTDAVDRFDEMESSEAPDDVTVDEPGDDSDEAQWRFGVDEVGEDAPTRDPLEPESVSLENALFVVVGVLLTVGIFLVGLL